MEISSDLIVSPIQIKSHCIAAGFYLKEMIISSKIFLFFRLLNPSSSYRSQMSDDDDQSSITNEIHLFRT